MTPLHRELLRLLLLLVSAPLLGLPLGHPWPALALGLLLLLLWHLYQARRLLQWSQDKERPLPYFPKGVWLHLAQLTATLHQRNRKRKRKLNRFFRQFRGATASVPDALLILDRSGTINWCNQASVELLGIHWPTDRDAYFGDRFSHPEVIHYLEEGNYNAPLEFTSPINNALILAMNVTYFGKKRYQRLVIVRDITRIRNLDHIRRDLIANISHELRTPLTVLYGYLETLLEEKEECSHWQRPLEQMAQQATRMQHVISDLLTLSRLEMNPTQRAETPIDVPRLLATILEEAAALTRNTRHPITTRIDPGLWLQGSEEELRSAFSNLIYNAIRHTPADTPIEVYWGVRYNGLVFSVRDRGPGIEAQHISRLSERFYRIDPARSRQTGGTGLGLAIVRQITQRYSGHLRITSTPGEGSTFSCIFPKSLAEPLTESAVPPSPQR